jgi:hypothetical protein
MDVGDLLARDSDAGAAAHPTQASVEPLKLSRLRERAAPE